MTLNKAKDSIKLAWIATLIVGLSNAMLTFVYGSGGTIADVTLWNWVDVFLPLLLTVGIYKKSRVSVFVMLIYFTATKLIILVEAVSFIGVPVTLAIIYILFQGFRATLTYAQFEDGGGEETAVA